MKQGSRVQSSHFVMCSHFVVVVCVQRDHIPPPSSLGVLAYSTDRGVKEHPGLGWSYLKSVEWCSVSNFHAEILGGAMQAPARPTESPWRCEDVRRAAAALVIVR